LALSLPACHHARHSDGDDQILSSTRLDPPFDYVAGARIIASRFLDFPAKTLVIRFSKPQTVLSSLSGWREGIVTVGNHYTAPPAWPATHCLGLEGTEKRTMALLGLERQSSSFLYTGADMANLAYAERESDGFLVGVFATAGVKGNAQRASVDIGEYVEQGTINLIILTNRKLAPEAMARALVTATEAKTAALEDLDIRSSYSGKPATGTGTDNVLVAEGSGVPAAMTGGHVKLGELMAKAVYAAVREAIARQNGLFAQRDIGQRLAERKIHPALLLEKSGHIGASRKAVARAVEALLDKPRYAGFLAGALALSDSRERGLARDTSAFSSLCLAIAGELAGKPVRGLAPAIVDESVPPVLREALNALATGVLQKRKRATVF
jgi:adenosylcobinamide amidohydrolase